MPDIILYKFLFNLEFLKDALLPEFKGSTFRGAVGWHLKKAVDTLKPVYDNVFETEGDENNPAVLKGVKKIPHPFILHPPLINKRDFKTGEIITVGITLIGYAHNFLPFFVEAFTTMGEAGITSKGHKFKLRNVLSEDFYKSKYLVYERGLSKSKKNYKAITNKDILKNIDYSTASVKLIFETPFLVQDKDGEIKENGKNRITPKLLVTAIENRYKSLAQLFCRSTTDIKKIFIPDQSVEITNVDIHDYKMHSFSNRSNSPQEFEGLTGSIKLKGNLKSILPILYIGEKINIGKKTSYGWGQYKIAILD